MRNHRKHIVYQNIENNGKYYPAHPSQSSKMMHTNLELANKVLQNKNCSCTFAAAASMILRSSSRSSQTSNKAQTRRAVACRAKCLKILFFYRLLFSFSLPKWAQWIWIEAHEWINLRACILRKASSRSSSAPLRVSETNCTLRQQLLALPISENFTQKMQQTLNIPSRSKSETCCMCTCVGWDTSREASWLVQNETRSNMTGKHVEADHLISVSETGPACVSTSGSMKQWNEVQAQEP